MNTKVHTTTHTVVPTVFDNDTMNVTQVFQWLRCGMAPSRLSSLGLSPSAEGPQHRFPALEEALHRLGWTTPLQEGLFATLAAVLHLLGSKHEEAARQLGADPKDLQELLDCSTARCVARQLYAHLLRWLGQCICSSTSLCTWIHITCSSPRGSVLSVNMANIDMYGNCLMGGIHS